MLFNSLEYLFLFLPATVLVYFLLNRVRYPQAARAWLVLASLFFYGWWNPRFVLLLLASIAFNYIVGRTLARAPGTSGSRRLLVFGIVVDLLVLVYFKYTNFFIAVVNSASGSNIGLLDIVLPLGVSFFTFTQIAFLVDAWRGLAREYNPVHYALFVTYFPHLIAGPILHHGEMMPQFADARNDALDWQNIYQGVVLFSIGLFKKVVIADQFAVWANAGFNSDTPLPLASAWITSLSYTLQIYFDFSGYTDMALGASLLLNIRLPLNFQSPYQAVNIQDFWRRWHMTLSRWLRDYLYIPLGGSRGSSLVTYRNLWLTFLLGGFWHGANWTFIVWGALHGAATVVHKAWQDAGLRMPRWLGWLITFLFVNVAWVFFRADSVTDALAVLAGMLGHHGTGTVDTEAAIWLAVCGAAAVLLPNAMALAEHRTQATGGIRGALLTGFTAAIPLYMLAFMTHRVTEFIYFNF